MNGAREYAKLFRSGQRGRLYLESSSHARGNTFHIYVLPKDAVGRTKDSVEVYGVISGQPGWTESYGWLHVGPWVDDFEKLVAERKQELADQEIKNKQIEEDKYQEKRKREKELLSGY